MESSIENKAVLDVVTHLMGSNPALGRSILMSHKFNLGELDDMIMFDDIEKIVPFMQCPSVFSLPANNCSFTFGDSLVIHAIATNGFIETALFQLEPNSIMQSSAICLHDFAGQRFTYRTTVGSDYDSAKFELAVHIRLLASCLVLLNCENVTVLENITEATKYRPFNPNMALDKKWLIYRTVQLSSNNHLDKLEPTNNPKLKEGRFILAGDKVFWEHGQNRL